MVISLGLLSSDDRKNLPGQFRSHIEDNGNIPKEEFPGLILVVSDGKESRIRLANVAEHEWNIL